jgi:hypothetical protein
MVHVHYIGQYDKLAPKNACCLYRTSAGADVVLDWLRGLAPKDRNTIGQDLMRV